MFHWLLWGGGKMLELPQFENCCCCFCFIDFLRKCFSAPKNKQTKKKSGVLLFLIRREQKDGFFFFYHEPGLFSTMLCTLETRGPGVAHTSLVPTMAALFLDENLPDGTRLEPDTKFIKYWKMRNSGTISWTPETKVLLLCFERRGSTLSAPQHQPPNHHYSCFTSTL